MRPKLLKSFIVTVVFWFIATTLWWSIQKPEVNLATLRELARLFPVLPIDVPAQASIMESLGVQRQVLLFWSLPVLTLTVLSAILGALLVVLFTWRKIRDRKARETGSGEYRGTTLSVGPLPMPHPLPKDDISLDATDNELLAKMSPEELRLLEDILGTISAAEDPYPGDGVSVSLLEHTLTLVEKALLHAKRHPGLAAIVAAAHEMGKITAFKRGKDGSWEPTAKKQDKEAARILGMIDSWYALPYEPKQAVMMAVKYYSTPRSIPDVDGNPEIYRFARELLYGADDAIVEAVVEQKQKVYEEVKVPDVVFDTFCKALPTISFQNRGLPRGVNAIAWKIGSRVYMLEIKLRETVMAKLPDEVKGALVPNPKERSRVQPFTVELLKALDERGWLVKEVNGTKLPTKEALWNIKAGSLDFRGVIVIDVPAEFLPQLPADDSMYKVDITGPLFAGAARSTSPASPGLSAMGKDDLLGSVLKPASGAAKGV